MCDDHPSTASRRTALGLLGVSLAAGLGGSAAPGHLSAGSPTAVPGSAGAAPSSSASPSTATSPTPGPGVPKRLRRSFVPDFTLPPIQGGLAPVITKIPTKHPVVFLTIDDGVVKSPESVRLLAENDFPATLFLTSNTVRDNPAFFKAFMAQGSLVENHTVSHNVNMTTQWGYQRQLDDITGMQDFAVQQYGRKPTLFRPPGGSYSTAMRQAVAAAGLKAIVTWEAKANAGRMDYQYGNSLRPGDIVLMHFRPEFAADFAAFRSAQVAAGLEVVLLEDFLGVA
ncbi:polysaccharide deacetylase family protein [Arthrobacter sp. MI7-26]|uniref:polysaccharide deacetylase family protein n=1 Tax=Arthrobacter sp. MI7-26 TaxID=2993653 RepID=UPI0022490921|nr:polysaccharide deacetylase family protein [Arthrobacter sp. MI7-26]MCX2749518.1 polysaccharide deacetylase family protein [Arthrobacter sp. MI7-26]